MRGMLPVCLVTGAVALFLAAGMPLPVEGVWEGRLEGLKAATLAVHAVKGKLQGSVVFYLVLRDGGTARIASQAEVAMKNPRWDGRTLRFLVDGPRGEASGPGVAFEMTVTGVNRTDLKCLVPEDRPCAALPMQSRWDI